MREDVWNATCPPNEPEHIPVRPKPASKAGLQPLPGDPNTLVREFEAWMPERIAVIKLRGFLEDFGGRIATSEPGVLRMHIGEPSRGDCSPCSA